MLDKLNKSKNNKRLTNEEKRYKKDSIDINRKRLLNNDSPFAVKEAYVKLRTGMTFCMSGNKKGPCTVFSVTSAHPSEGKSLTSANIAISFAMLGKKVLLIDADMRKPTQRKLWQIKNKYGLCDFLAGFSQLEISKVCDLPLWIVCTGTIPPNPSELLSSERMRFFVEQCAKRYDYVIIDTPPINTVADAQIISSFVDGMVVVIRSGSTTKEELSDALSAVRNSGGNLCGVVLNGINPKTTGKYSYKYKYESKYQYQYEYSNTKNE